MNNPTLLYKPPGPVALSFLNSNAFFRGLMGPIGSGKSTACIIEILKRSQLQIPSPDGIRRTRWAVIRSSYPELKSTSVRSWFQWCPAEYGKVNFDSPIIHHVKAGSLDMEVMFLALDRPDDIRKLLSLELTGAWLNEARETPKAILDTLTGRVGRYPGKAQGGCTWSGIIADTNPPDTESWWYKLSEEERPKDWEFFTQPSGISPEAENRENLHPQYYERLLAGKDPDWIKVYVEGSYGFVVEGKPVFPMFRDRIHTATESLEPSLGLPLLIGVDFGLTPAAVIAQKHADGRWVILDELVTDNHGIQRFGELLTQYIATEYPDFEVACAWGDPSGIVRNSEEKTAFDIINEYCPWKTKAAPGDNTLTPRLEVVAGALSRLIDGNPGLTISPKCRTLRKGFSGSYHYKLLRSGDGSQTHETPNKNEWSHVHDALQYLLLGGGEFGVVMNKLQRRERGNSPRMAKNIDYPIFGRR